MTNDAHSPRRFRPSERGYNLIEMLVSIAILGTVLVSIMTLFFMGTSNIYSGKQMTRANSIGTLVMEDLSSLTQDDVLQAFGIIATTTLGNVDVDTTAVLPNDLYTSSIIRRSNSIGAGEDARGLLARWQAAIDTDGILSNGYVALVITPRNPVPKTAAVTAGNASSLRVRIVVRWTEGLRPRQVIMDTFKLNRP